jgi:hypothetical protein
MEEFDSEEEELDFSGDDVDSEEDDEIEYLEE